MLVGGQGREALNRDHLPFVFPLLCGVATDQGAETFYHITEEVFSDALGKVESGMRVKRLA